MNAMLNNTLNMLICNVGATSSHAYMHVFIISAISSLPERKPTLLYRFTANRFYLLVYQRLIVVYVQIQDILSTKYRKKYLLKSLYLFEWFNLYFKIQFLFINMYCSTYISMKRFKTYFTKIYRFFISIYIYTQNLERFKIKNCINKLF